MNTRVCAFGGLLLKTGKLRMNPVQNSCMTFCMLNGDWVRLAADSLSYHDMLKMRGGAKACTMQVQARRVTGEQLTSLMQGWRQKGLCYRVDG